MLTPSPFTKKATVARRVNTLSKKKVERVSNLHQIYWRALVHPHSTTDSGHRVAWKDGRATRASV
jgi:hypothetical protein